MEPERHPGVLRRVLPARPGREQSEERCMRNVGTWSPLGLVALLALGCSSGGSAASSEAPVLKQQAVTVEDGLAQAYTFFKGQILPPGLDQQYRIGAGFHPG